MFPVCRCVNKKIDGLTEHCAVKFCLRLKKSKVELINLLKEAFQILVVSDVEM